MWFSQIGVVSVYVLIKKIHNINMILKIEDCPKQLKIENFKTSEFESFMKFTKHNQKRLNKKTWDQRFYINQGTIQESKPKFTQ